MQIFGRSVGGALAAGSVSVVKPAGDACLSLIRVAQLAAEVGFPAGAINIVTGYGHGWATPWPPPGRRPHQLHRQPLGGHDHPAGGSGRHCPVTLELGGKSPQIIFADADLDAALPFVINAIVRTPARPAAPARAC